MFETGEALFWVESAEVEELHGAFEGGGDEFVHLDVSAVELEVADAVEEVGVPAG